MRPLPALLALCSALLAVALPAAAQTPADSVAWERFFPAAIGDTWTYVVTEGQFCTSSQWVTTVEVVGESVVNGDRVPRFRTSRAGWGTLELERWIRVSAGDTWFTTTGDATLWPLGQNPFTPPSPLFVFTNDEPVSPTAVTIGGQAESVDAVKTFYGSDTRSDIQHRFAAGIGLYYHSRYYDSSGCARRSVRYELRHARVGGVEYGVPVPPTTLSLEIESPIVYVADPEAALRLTVTGLFTLPSYVLVIDSTGAAALTGGPSQLPVGTTRHVLDVSTLVPGSYRVRAVADGIVSEAPLTIASATVSLALDPAVVSPGTSETALALTVVGGSIDVRVDVADSTGAVVLTRTLGQVASGMREVVLDVSTLDPGVYTVRAVTSERVSEAVLTIEPRPTPLPSSETALAVRPNPAGPSLTATLTLASGGTARAEVVDLLGRVVLSQALGAQEAGETGTYVLNTGALPAGPYVLRVVTPEGVLTRRFVRGL